MRYTLSLPGPQDLKLVDCFPRRPSAVNPEEAGLLLLAEAFVGIPSLRGRSTAPVEGGFEVGRGPVGGRVLIGI